MRGLKRAALSLDAGDVSRILRRGLTAGVVPAWMELISPALREIGSHEEMTGHQVAAEHLLSNVASAALAGVRRPSAPARILLACADEEQHSLPLEALAAALAERDTASRMLGARVPTWALHDAIVRTGPAVVLLWSHTTRTAGHEQLRAVLAIRPRPVLVGACGPGWSGRLPVGVLRPASLPEAVELLGRPLVGS